MGENMPEWARIFAGSLTFKTGKYDFVGIKHIGEFELGQSMTNIEEYDSLVFNCHYNRLKYQSCLRYFL